MVKINPDNSSSGFFVLSDFKVKDYSINDLVLSHVVDLNNAKFNSKDKSEKRTNVFSVSQSSYDCYRKIYFEMTHPRKPDLVTESGKALANKTGTFLVGDIIHTIIQDAFVKKGAFVEVGCGKSYFDNKLRIQGHADIKLDDTAIEIKSVGSFAWKYIAGGKDKLGNVIQPSPKIAHVRQMNMYLDLLGVEKGIILYVNKDSICGSKNSMCCFGISKDESMVRQTIGKCVKVYESIVSERIPEAVKGTECSYCNHSDLCKGR